jgi:ABC-type bacteriocin/lantibiotic exporter with double-glycine peptidase domain
MDYVVISISLALLFLLVISTMSSYLLVLALAALFVLSLPLSNSARRQQHDAEEGKITAEIETIKVMHSVSSVSINK